MVNINQCVLGSIYCAEIGYIYYQVVSSGFLYVPSDTFTNLTSQCVLIKTWALFPCTGFIGMHGVISIGTLMVDVISTVSSLDEFYMLYIIITLL